jgi:methylenetetrahydrofolate reductase (NADPH)
MTETKYASPGSLAALLSTASVEVSSRGHQLAELRDHFSPGIDVTITFLPGDDYRHNVETAAALRRLGFNPVLHVAAREMRSRDALDDFLTRARAEAEANRILVIAGDSLRALGPFKSSADICASGAIEAHGIGAVSFAGHPEGHPQLDAEKAMAALSAKRDWGRRSGVRVDLITQFCFESGPILAWLKELEAHDLDIPVHIGLAGPASPTTLFKFALRCGVGNSLKSLREHIGRFGRLLIDTGPDDVLRGLWTSPSIAKTPIAGLHFFPFGGLSKTSQWLRNFDSRECSRQVAHTDTVSSV